MFLNSCNSKRDREIDYLEWELERERAWREEEETRRERERQERINNIRQSYEWSLRQADDWHDALHKQQSLCAREGDMEWLDNRWYDGQYFGETARACKRALEIWPAEEAKVADEIAALEKRIAELRNGVRIAVGKRLEIEKQFNSPGWRGVAATLQDPDEDPSSWLNW